MIWLNDVNFINVKIRDTINRYYVCAVIMIVPDYGLHELRLIYNYGSVSNQGEPDNLFYSSFLYAISNKIWIRNVNFHDNTAFGTEYILDDFMRPYSGPISRPLINLIDVLSAFENTKFIRNYQHFGLIKSMVYSELDGNILVVDCDFTENSSIDAIIYVEPGHNPQGLTNVYFSQCVSETKIIDFYMDSYNYYGYLFFMFDTIFEDSYADNLVSCSGTDVHFQNVNVI